MPRIDPERLLKCLLPLLDPVSGAIKSCDEVDKILGLMSKFSKKLVSKCIYMNILKSSHISVVDLFMQRGGWGLVHGWTSEAVTAKNYPLLKEILQLLLQIPITIARLKENRFPVLIKNLSKDCEDLDTRNLSKQVMTRWFSIAKGEENQPHQPLEFHVGNVGLPIDQNAVNNHSGNVPQELGNLNNVTADSLLNIDPTFIPDAETEKHLLEITNTDLSTIDFNLDILSKVVDHQPMEEGLSEVISTTSIVHHVGGSQIPIHNTSNILPTNVVFSNANTYSMQMPTTTTTATLIQQQHQPVKPEVIDLIQVQSAPKIYIKTIAGQKTVVQGLGSEPGQYCLLIKGDKNYVVKVKEPSAPTVQVLHKEEPVQVLEATSSGIKTEDTPDSAPKVKKSKSHKKEKEPKISSTNKSSSGSSTLKTYGSPKPKSASAKDTSSSTKKPPDHNSKPEKAEKDKEKRLVKESGSSDGHKKPKSSSSRNKADAAAAAAKQLAEEDKLRDQIRTQKALMKKRAKEAEKQKQQEKDQETLKKLNLAPPSSTSPSSSMKIPKIPKKSTSFIDAIGIPGSDGVSSLDKIKKITSDKPIKSTEEGSTPASPTKKTPSKKEDNETEDSEKPKERRHKPKVFVSSKSRSDDLLKEMTESGKNNKSSKEKEKEKGKDEIKSSSTSGNSIPAVPPPTKISKRLSTESIEKPGDPKKAKLIDVPSSKVEKDKAKEAKESAKEKKKPTIALKESSLFMDMLTAETAKPSKRKRRLSTGNGNEKSELPSPIEKSPKLQNSSRGDSEDIIEIQAQEEVQEEPLRKPVFNFYRDTLNDSPEEERNEEKGEQSAEVAPRGDVEEPMEQDIEERGSFTPQENDGKLKSALCLIRPRNRPRKSVKWKEEEDLREFHFFEMDETERVNVTKQKDFSEMSQHEKAIERSFLKRKTDEEEQQSQWRLPKIAFKTDVIQPPILSQEKGTQEERERNILAPFLPPGAPLPETAHEPDLMSPIDRLEPKFIPVEDVNSITKVCDFRTHSWPPPKGLHSVGYNMMPQEMENSPQNCSLSSFPPVSNYNPWNNPGFQGVPPPVPAPIPVPDMSPFHFPPPGGLNMGMNYLGTVPPVPVGFPPNPNPFAFPPPLIPQVNGPPPHGGVDAFGSHNRDGRMGPNRGGRFNNGADQRRNFHGSRDRDAGRDRGTRDRDYRDDRGGRDRDFRRRDRDNRDTSDRDYRHHDRDRDRNNRDRDHRSGSGSSGRNTRKDIPCRYFKKGTCSSGSRCEFLHEGGSNSHEDGKSISRQDSHDSSRSRRSPPDSHSRDVDLRQSSVEEDWDGEPQPKPTTPNDVDATRFALPPSSPTEPEMPVFAAAATESTKVIPV